MKYETNQKPFDYNLARALVFPLTIVLILLLFSVPAMAKRYMENLDRGVVAVRTASDQVFISWRILGTEWTDTGYNLYRGNTKLNASPITGASNYVDTCTTDDMYSVAAVVNGVEQGKSDPVDVWSQFYKTIPLSLPSGGTTPDGVSYTYSPNDCSVGDLDGDGAYEIVVKWDPSNAKDNSQSGYTGKVFLDAYELNGTFLWRIDLGRNIRAGAHYTQFMVYDLDSDGMAEVACKTADGTRDGNGNVIGDASADYRNSSGYVLSGPEYFTIFRGTDGAALQTVNYEPARGTVSSWGDAYGNRVDRFLACVAYLDGYRPSVVMARGYYTRTVLVAWDWRDGTLTRRWTFDSDDSGNSGYAGQGNHNLAVADVDDDGRDEIVYGSMTVDENGYGLYTTGLGHGDAMHVGDLNPNRAGLEIWQAHESGSGATFRDTQYGTVLWRWANSGDVGRALSADIEASVIGEEVWASGSSLFSATGTSLGSSPSQCNFAIWWDGDLSRELLDGTKLDKWASGSQSRLVTLYNYAGASSNNGTKSTPNLSADILGDWREEILLRSNDNLNLILFTTTTPTTTRLYTLMHDPTYRLAVAWQNVAYNQPPHPGFYLGNNMPAPPTPDIILIGEESSQDTDDTDTTPTEDEAEEDDAETAAATCDNPLEITVPFSQNGAGEYCWVTSDEISYINSWVMDLVEINGFDYTNSWSDQMPDSIDGNYYIRYVGSYSWSHFEVNGEQ